MTTSNNEDEDPLSIEIQGQWQCECCDGMFTDEDDQNEEALEAQGIEYCPPREVYDGTTSQYREHDYVCMACVEDNFYWSNYYGEFQLYDVDDTAACDNFECDCCSMCERCEDRVDSDDIHYCESCEEYACRGCMDNGAHEDCEEEYSDPRCQSDCCNSMRGMGVVTNYSADVLDYCRVEGEAIFGYTEKDSKDALTLGVELELVPEFPSDHELIHNVHHAFYKPHKPRGSKNVTVARHCLTKSDASISPHGYELVTVPATLAYHKVLWQDFFNVCAKGFIKESDSCGMHIHIGRAQLSELTITKMILFANHKDNRSFIIDMAGRESNRWARLEDNMSWDCIREHRERYQFFNLQRSTTVECRAFPNTVDKDVIFKNMELVHAIASFAKTTSTSRLDVSSFVEFVRLERRMYPHLHRHILAQKYENLSSKVMIPESRLSKTIKKVQDTVRTFDTSAYEDFASLASLHSDYNTLSIRRGGKLRREVELKALHRIKALLDIQPTRYKGRFIGSDGISWLVARAKDKRLNFTYGELCTLESWSMQLGLTTLERTIECIQTIRARAHNANPTKEYEDIQTLSACRQEVINKIEERK